MAEILEIVSKYVYLGSTISGDGDGMGEIRKRLAMAMHRLTKMKFLWKGQDAQQKPRILRACIFPIATYGCEAWMFGKTNLKRINAFEMKCYRKILRILDRVQNKQVNKKRTLSGRTMARELCEDTEGEIFWSFERSGGLGKIILEGRINGKREIGRPRRQWERDIEDAFSRPITVVGKLAIDRECFQSVVKDATSSRIRS